MQAWIFNKNYAIAKMKVEEVFLCEDRAWHLTNIRMIISDLQKKFNR